MWSLPMKIARPFRAACYSGVIAALANLLAAPVSAQNQRPASSNPFDVVGVWVPAGGGPTFFGALGFQEDADEREHGPGLVDYAGMPLNAAGLAHALSYDPSLLSVPEHQCMPH